LTADARIEALQKDAADVAEDLSKRPTWADMQELRHQLAIVHAVAFNAASDDVDCLSPSKEQMPFPPLGVSDSKRGSREESEVDGASDESMSGNDVHLLLLRRIRLLESRLVRAETTCTESEAANGSLQARLDSAQDTISDQAALISRLDDALSSRLILARPPAASVANAGVSSIPAASVAPVSSLLSPQVQLESLFGSTDKFSSSAIAQISSLPLPPPEGFTTGSENSGPNEELVHILQVCFMILRCRPAFPTHSPTPF
jgi:hypothetical protein